jgi:hypothetical protein
MLEPFKRAIKFVWDAIKIIYSSLNKVGTWLMSILACLLLPCLPIVIGGLRDGKLDRESMIITAAILAATFIFTAGHQILRVVYILLFISALLLDTIRSDFASVVMETYAGSLFLGVACLQAAERFWWHIALDRPFPEK